LQNSIFLFFKLEFHFAAKSDFIEFRKQAEFILFGDTDNESVVGCVYLLQPGLFATTPRFRDKGLYFDKIEFLAASALIQKLLKKNAKLAFFSN